MLKPIIALLVVLTLGADDLSAQETKPATKAAAEAKPRGETAPSKPRAGAPGQAAPTEPAAQKPGFFKRVFGRKSTPAPAATPAPATPAPKPKRKPRPAAKPVAEQEAATPAPAKVEENATAEPAEPTAEPAPAGSPGEAPAVTPPTTPAPKKKGGREPKGAGKKPVAAAADLDPVAQEKAKYDEARAKALEDAEVKALKEKADSAANEEEGRRALRAYNKALFSKIRRLDPSVKDRADSVEAGVMKRLGSE